MAGTAFRVASPRKRISTGSTALPISFALCLTLAAAIVLSLISGFPGNRRYVSPLRPPTTSVPVSSSSIASKDTAAARETRAGRPATTLEDHTTSPPRTSTPKRREGHEEGEREQTERDAQLAADSRLHEQPTIRPPTTTKAERARREEESQAQPRRDDQRTTSSDGDPGSSVCPPIILISAARHGSTWFLDSASGCMYSAGLDGTYRNDVFKRTEIWTGRAGPVEEISPQKALEYVRKNSSVKFMQTTLREHVDRAEALLRLAKKADVPVVVLRRRAVEAFRSRKEAHDRGDWRVTSYEVGGTSRREEEELDEASEAQLKKFTNGLEKYFGVADLLLDKVGNTLVDRFDYDDVKDEEFIHAENSGCYIRNCNYVED